MQIILITSPSRIENETIICNLLFDSGLEILHLRKPGASAAEYIQFLQDISPCYRNRIVIHEHYELAGPYGLRGIHLKSGEARKAKDYPGIRHISISCHALEEIRALAFRPAYCFLSPVFDSISKEGYKSPFSRIPDMQEFDIPVVALGGITPDKIHICRTRHFAGVAVLGYVWERPEEAIQRFIRLKTPFVLSIAGFDPSSGAGVTADIKTFENCRAYGLGVTSAITFQNEDEYSGTRWTDLEDLYSQLEILYRKYAPACAKIGLVRDFVTLHAIVSRLHELDPDIKIVWDPILKASAGFTFHQKMSKLPEILEHIYLLTPNTEELKGIFGEQITLSEIHGYCRKYNFSLLWKGGHNPEVCACDRLITASEIKDFTVQRSPYQKHGTGCALSAAITCYLSQGYSLAKACNKAQLYVSHLMDSNDSKLSYHFSPEDSFVLKPCPAELRIQYITDYKEGISIAGQVEAVCRGGIRWIQLRMKEATEEDLLREGKLVKAICQRYNALFIVDDNVHVARQLNADGVHLGKEDMSSLEARELLGPDKIIGATCNTYEDILLCSTQQADYIGLGPFSYTETKKKLSPVLGLEGYYKILFAMKEAGIHIPVFAIGGITETDIPSLMQTGVQGIAVSGLIKNSRDISKKSEEVLKSLR